MLLTALALSLCAPGPREHCVVDGDTFWHEGEKIRISDIDTPELNSQCAYERNLAVKARNRLLTILQAPYRINRHGEDRYGRTLAVVTINGRSVGDMLVSEGLALTWTGRREPWCD
ncbi:MAG: thermonuclease family protein [Erythrobacter sp.]|nr:thermonuclease family protein [Erythrobacter sp.]